MIVFQVFVRGGEIDRRHGAFGMRVRRGMLINYVFRVIVSTRSRAEIPVFSPKSDIISTMTLSAFLKNMTRKHEMTSSRRPSRYGVIFLAVALVFGALLALAECRRNPLNDPDQARQRTGVLLPAHTYPSPTLEDEPRPGHRTIFFFTRNLAGLHLFSDLADQSDLAGAADLIVVTSDGSKPVIEGGIQRFVTDADGSLAKAFGLRAPIDGGPPVGYVLVDSQGHIRFRTLDPGFQERAWEIKLLLGEMS